MHLCPARLFLLHVRPSSPYWVWFYSCWLCLPVLFSAAIQWSSWSNYLELLCCECILPHPCHTYGVYLLLRDFFQFLWIPPTAILASPINLGDVTIGYAKATIGVGVSGRIEPVTCVLWLSAEDSLWRMWLEMRVPRLSLSNSGISPSLPVNLGHNVHVYSKCGNRLHWLVKVQLGFTA